MNRELKRKGMEFKTCEYDIKEVMTVTEATTVQVHFAPNQKTLNELLKEIFKVKLQRVEEKEKTA